MVAHATATSRGGLKVCPQCGCSYATGPGYCSFRCMNLARTDHSEKTLMHRFWAKVDKSAGHGPNGDCWHWTGRVDGKGYGEIKVAGRYKKAHRLALFGMADLLNPLYACHRCDNPRCVRPDHLFAGEAIDNVRDMFAKGRDYRSRKAGCSHNPERSAP